MRRVPFAVLAVVAGCGPQPAGPPAGDPEPAGTVVSWSFDGGTALPAGSEVPLGDWVVEGDPDAPSAPNVLRQAETFPSPDFPRVLLGEELFFDLDLSVRCRLESGEIDQVCGLMFRAWGPDDYYLTRANALEDNVRLYTVVAGNRVEIASIDMDVSPEGWHTLEVSAVGAELAVSWDGEEVLSFEDTTFDAPGQVGLWTKADAVTAFDDAVAVAR